MLIATFATRTGSTSDPLIERALYLLADYMDLTGIFSSH